MLTDGMIFEIWDVTVVVRVLRNCMTMGYLDPQVHSSRLQVKG